MEKVNFRKNGLLLLWRIIFQNLSGRENQCGIEGSGMLQLLRLVPTTGRVEHNLKSCPLKYRLRRMIHARYLSSGSDVRRVLGYNLQ
jgi:hypothetical protein